MSVNRKLLYHRGIDDQASTYVTDYIEGAICFLLGTYLLIIVWSKKIDTERKLKKDTNIKRIIAVVIIKYSIALTAILGGLTHQFLQEVEPYETWQDDWTWLIVWRITTSFSAFLGFGFILLGQQLLNQEGMLQIKKAWIWFGFGITANICFGVFIYSLLMVFHTKDPWSIKNTFFCVYAFALAECLAATATFFKKSLIFPKFLTMWLRLTCFGNLDTKEDNIYVQNRKSSFNAIVSSNTDEFRIDLFLHMIAPWLFLFSGLTQFLLGASGCADHDDAEIYPCPLPKYFNHNALLHIMVTFSSILFFFAEIFSLKRKEKVKRQLIVKENSSTSPLVTNINSV